MATRVLKNGTLVDPVAGREYAADVRIDLDTGTVMEIGDNLSGDDTLDCSGLFVMPGWIDIRAHFHDPGKGSRESIPNGAAAAASGGFTAVAIRSDTRPPIDNIAGVTYIRSQSENISGATVYPTGTITKNADGVELAEIGRMSHAGAVGFSDGDGTLASAVLLHSALQYASMFDKVIIDMPQNPELAVDIQIHEGKVSARLGMKALPTVAEVIQIGRNVRLADAAGGRLHLPAITARESLKIIRSAKRHGVRVSADVSPVHLLLTDREVMSFDPVFKTFPPLREDDDVAALKQAYVDGVIDCVCSNHQPLTAEELGVEFPNAPFGASTLEITVGVTLSIFHNEMGMPLLEIARRQSLVTREIIGVPGGGFAPDDPADFTIVDPKKKWTVDTRAFVSKGKNCPLRNMTLIGGPIWSVIGGTIHQCIAAKSDTV